MRKVYLQVKGHVFECLPSQTEIEYENLSHGSLVDPCGTYVISKFRAALTTEQPWECEVQMMWYKLPKKKRTVRMVIVDEESATELIFKDVDITYISDISGEEFTSKGPNACRPLIPMLKGETRERVKTVVHTHAWWQR